MTSTTQARPTTTSAPRALRLRIRPDLQIVPQRWLGRDYWVIKDPVALKYFRFEAEELAILKQLDGSHSADEIRKAFEREFAPQRLSQAGLHQLIAMLHRSGLVISDSPGQGEQLHERHCRQRGRELRQQWTSPLAIRFKGFDPDRLLGGLQTSLGSLFSWPALMGAIALGCFALALLATRFETLTARLPGFEEFFAGNNWLWLALVLIVTKVLHELGHGLACKRFGGECHEAGVMLLVFMPCLYCNVSDSWMLPDKWKRAAIAAAGMYVELVLASIATVIWCFSQPGLINQVALDVMVVCSVTTLLFNANPLLKYDGYYILSDLIEVPNLRQKATTLVQRAASAWLLGVTIAPDPFLPARRRWLFATYAIAAVIYRWVLTLSIFWFLYRLLEPWGLKVLGQMLAMGALWGLVGLPLLQFKRHFSVPGRWWAVKKPRLGLVAGLGAALLGGVLFFPVPHRVRCPFYVQPVEAANVFVPVAGFVQTIHVRNGQPVSAGDMLVTLESPDLSLQVERLQGELDKAHQRVLFLEQAAGMDPTIGAELDAARATKVSATNRLRVKLTDSARLVIRAPSDGVFVADTQRPAPEQPVGQLVSWHGSPVAQRNIGAWYEVQTRVGRIVPGVQTFQAVLAVDQGDIEFIRSDQPVRLWLREQPGKILRAATQEVSPAKMVSVPAALSSRCGGDLVTTRNGEGLDEPHSATWQVGVGVETDQPLVSGATGVALVRVGSQPLAGRLWRGFCRTFRFEL